MKTVNQRGKRNVAHEHFGTICSVERNEMFQLEEKQKKLPTRKMLHIASSIHVYPFIARLVDQPF